MERIAPEILHFCKEISETDLKKLPFQRPRFEGISNAWLASQARCYQMVKAKIPSWWANGNLIFPDPQAVEQCTSEWVAKWKQTLVPDRVDALIDLSAGMGVDSWFLGKGLKTTILVEPDLARASLLQQNFSALGLPDTRIEAKDAFSFLQQNLELLSSKTMVYVDPDRRGETGKRLAAWRDTEPNLKSIVELLRGSGSVLLAKLSPMDDLDELILEFPDIQFVYTVSLHNEVKEILLFFGFSNQESFPMRYAVEISRSGFYRLVEVSNKSGVQAGFIQPEPGHFFYDPWAAIRKGYQIDLLSTQFPVTLLSPHSQLFVGQSLLPDFPGRVFQINTRPISLKVFGAEWTGKAISVISRGKTETAENIKKKFKLKDGGNQYLICVQGVDNQIHYFITTRFESQRNMELWQSLPD